MSLSILPLELVNEIPQEFDLKSKRMFSVLNGPQEFTPRVFQAQGVSNSGFTVQADPPSENDLIYPVFWKRVRFTVSVSVTRTSSAASVGFRAVDGNLATAVAGDFKNGMAPRAFPLSKVMNTESVSLNGTQFTTNLKDYENAFIRYCNDNDTLYGKFSMTQSRLDDGHSYDSLGNSFRDVFASYKDTILGESRSAHCDVDYSAADAITVPLNGTATVLTFTFTTTEPVFCSPFWYQKKALTQIKSLTYNSNFGDLSRLVCVDGVNPLGAIGNAAASAITLTGIAVNSAELLFYYASPKLLDRIPKQLSYSFQEIQVFKSATTRATAGQTVAFQCPTTNFSSIPRRVIIWAEEIEADRLGLTNALMLKTDSFKASIESINVSFGTRSGLLSSATPQDLYYISKRNGLCLSYSQFRKYVGSVIALDFGKDIGLPTDMSVGVLSNPQFSLSGTLKELSGSAVNFVVKYAVIYDGVVNIINGSVSRQLGILSQNDVLETQLAGLETISDSDHNDNVFGGKLEKNGGFNPLAIMPLLQGVRKGMQMAGPVMSKVADVAESFGLGKKQKGGKIAGKLLSRGELLNGMYGRDENMM